MCYACLLLDKSLPTPKEMARTINELPADDHFFDVVDKLAGKTTNEYIDELVEEFQRITK